MPRGDLFAQQSALAPTLTQMSEVTRLALSFSAKCCFPGIYFVSNIFSLWPCRTS